LRKRKLFRRPQGSASFRLAARGGRVIFGRAWNAERNGIYLPAMETIVELIFWQA